MATPIQNNVSDIAHDAASKARDEARASAVAAAAGIAARIHTEETNAGLSSGKRPAFTLTDQGPTMEASAAINAAASVDSAAQVGAVAATLHHLDGVEEVKHFPNLTFSGSAWHGGISYADQVSIWEFFFSLPEDSLPYKFAQGTEPIPADVPGAVKTRADVFKPWHQLPNMHCTIGLSFVDAEGKSVKFGHYATAHVHGNGLETIIVHGTADKWVRQPGSEVYDVYPPPAKAARLAAEREAEKERLEAEREAEKERLEAEREAEKESVEAEMEGDEMEGEGSEGSDDMDCGE